MQNTVTQSEALLQQIRDFTIYNHVEVAGRLLNFEQPIKPFRNHNITQIDDYFQFHRGEGSKFDWFLFPASPELKNIKYIVKMQNHNGTWAKQTLESALLFILNKIS